MFGKFNKVLLGVALIEGVISGSCSGSDGSDLVSQFLSPTSKQIKLVSPSGVARLPRESQQNLLSTAIGCFSSPEFLATYLDRMSQSERGTFLSESLSMYFNIMAQMSRYGMQLIVHAEPTHLLQQRIESEARGPMDRQTHIGLSEVTIGELNRQLALLSIKIDDIGMSGKDPTVLKAEVNKTLEQYVSSHSVDKEYGDINFLLGLLKMLHRFPAELPPIITEKMPDILESIGYTETSSDKSPKEIIYDYIVEISEESLGQFHI